MYMAEIIIEELEQMSPDDFMKLEEKLRSIQEIKYYYANKNKDRDTLPDNYDSIIKDKIKIIFIEAPQNGRRLFEQNNYKVIMNIKGINNTVKLLYNVYDTDKTTDKNYDIVIGGKICRLGYFTSYSDYDKDSINILQQLHDTLEIPYNDTQNMVHLLFYGYFDNSNCYTVKYSLDDLLNSKS